MNHKYIRRLSVIPLILLAVICLVRVVKNNNQAAMPVPRQHVFSGEYSYDGENWYPYDEEGELSALRGDVIVRGHLDSDIEEGMILNMFCHHIGVSVSVNGEQLYIDTPTEIRNYGIDLMPSMCGTHWGQMRCPRISTEDELEFRLINYHKYGNKNAYKEVIGSLFVTPPDHAILEAYLESYVKPFTMTGYVLILAGVMLLGAALSAVVFKSSMSHRFFHIGIMTLFIGGYMVFDVMMIYFMDELLAVKTYGRQLCLMLAVYFIGLMVCDSLKDRQQTAAEMIMGISGVVNLGLILPVIGGNVLLYDTRLFWEITQCVISMLLIVLCVSACRKEQKIRKELLIYGGLHLAVLMDMAGVGYHMYFSGICLKTAYVVMLILFLFDGIKQVILDHHASIKNNKLKEELEQSRIAVILSQIHPHFLYNSLTSVIDLCDTDPGQAKAAIADFADYLRGNISSIRMEEPVSFCTELEHIKKYLSLEKLRFQEDLEVVYDIQARDFLLPALSVQPLVENAVKHGVGRKTGGGTVTIHTSETEQEYRICIADDGAGFVEGECGENGGAHVGIENTKKRLARMVHGRLEIESKRGEGTRACILIPKEGVKHGDPHSR